MCEDDDQQDIEAVVQQVLDEVPGHVWRQMPGANRYVKDAEWHSVERWLQDKEENDPNGITATSSDEDSSGGRVNLLGTLAQFRPVAAHEAHQQAAGRIVRAFYGAGLINMRIGRDRGTAILTTASCGNIEVAALLLEYGAGIPLWLLSGLFIRNYFPAGGHPFFLGWGYGGEGVVSERGEGRNGSGHDLSASRASAGCLSCQGVFVPITVGFFLCQGVAPSMVGGRNGIMARLVPPTTISNHISFPRPPISDFRYFITPFVLPCV